MRFWEAKFHKFPVVFPGSREFRRRMARARLRPPPRSLDCKETPLHSSGNPRKSPQLPGFAVKPHWRKCPAGPRSQAFRGFFLGWTHAQSGFKDPIGRGHRRLEHRHDVCAGAKIREDDGDIRQTPELCGCKSFIAAGNRPQKLVPRRLATRRSLCRGSVIPLRKGGSKAD